MIKNLEYGMKIVVRIDGELQIATVSKPGGFGVEIRHEGFSRYINYQVLRKASEMDILLYG